MDPLDNISWGIMKSRIQQDIVRYVHHFYGPAFLAGWMIPPLRRWIDGVKKQKLKYQEIAYFFFFSQKIAYSMAKSYGTNLYRHVE